MKVNILEEKQMREIGFTDYSKKNWYFFKRVCADYPITINFTINKKTKECEIDILDENFLQPYPAYKTNKEIYQNSKQWIDYMIEHGILSKNEEYI